MKIKGIISIVAVSVFLGSVSSNSAAIKQKNFLQSTAFSSYDSAELTEYAEQVAILVNRERTANGLQPVKFSPMLSEAANVRSSELEENFSHTRPNGTSCFTVLKEFSISYVSAAENIAYGQRTPEIVMNSWMNSSGHRANILSKNVDYIGVGVVYRNGIYYWTQLFAASKDLSRDAYLPGGNTISPEVTTASDIILTTTTTNVTKTTSNTFATKPITSKSTTITTENSRTTITAKPATAATQTTAVNKTVTCCTQTTTVSINTNKPILTLPESDNYINSDNGLFWVISPEQFDFNIFLQDSYLCKDKYYENAVDFVKKLIEEYN